MLVALPTPIAGCGAGGTVGMTRRPRIRESARKEMFQIRRNNLRDRGRGAKTNYKFGGSLHFSADEPGLLEQL